MLHCCALILYVAEDGLGKRSSNKAPSLTVDMLHVQCAVPSASKPTVTLPSPSLPLWPRFSGSWLGSVQPHVQEARSPAALCLGSPWFRSPPALFWTCSSTRSLTYSNIHSVTRGHRGEETIGNLSCQSGGHQEKTQQESKAAQRTNGRPPGRAPCPAQISLNHRVIQRRSRGMSKTNNRELGALVAYKWKWF